MQAEPITHTTILNKLCAHFNVQPEDFLTPTRGTDDMCHIRQMYVHCLYKFTNLKCREIGNLVLRNHTVVCETEEVIKRYCEAYPDYKQKVIELEALIEDIYA